MTTRELHIYGAARFLAAVVGLGTIVGLIFWAVATIGRAALAVAP